MAELGQCSACDKPVSVDPWRTVMVKRLAGYNGDV